MPRHLEHTVPPFDEPPPPGIPPDQPPIEEPPEPPGEPPEARR
ncbi:hypothetical protein [Paracidovorax citrulli]